jgi:hypothetical protein
MMFQRIAQPVDVLVAFRENRPEPMMFRWGNKHYQVRRVKTIYSEQSEVGKKIIFSVSDDRDVFRLSFRSDTMRWCLEEKGSMDVFPAVDVADPLNQVAV